MFEHAGIQRALYNGAVLDRVKSRYITKILQTEKGLIMGNQTLKERFVKAINEGELGLMDDYGVLVTREAFTEHFNDIKSQYRGSFLTAAVIEPGRTLASHTRFLFKMGRGLYLVHTDLLEIKPLKQYKFYELYYMNSDMEKRLKR